MFENFSLYLLRYFFRLLEVEWLPTEGTGRPRDAGSLTSRGMPLMPGLQHLGAKQTRAAAQRPSERVSLDA